MITRALKIVVAGLCLFAAVGGLRAAVTLTVTPSTTSNTYSGIITLQIGGLTNGQPVVVQRFIDFNANGVIDAGDVMMDTFSLTDGKASVIGGITNLSVPYDQNAATGAITTTLNFGLPMNFENVTVQSIYQVVSTNGGFTPVTALFVVTNAPQNQSVKGTVYRGATPAAYAMVAADAQPSGGLVAAVIADNTGHYALPLPVGSYKIFALLTNSYIDRALAPLVNLTNGMALTNNLYMTNGTVAISGKIYDSISTNSGLGGVWLTLESGNYLGSVFTSSNGTYSSMVGPGFWTPKVEEMRMTRRGYVIPRTIAQVNTTTGSVANVNIALPKGNALFYGRITDGANHPFFNVELDANDGNGNQEQYDCRGFSDTNGYYGVAVFAETNSWYSSPDAIENVQLANYIVSGGQSVTFSNSQTFHEDFIALPATGHITGRVLDNTGHPVVGVSVAANYNTGVNYYQSSSVDTDTNGYYILGVASGTWSVYFGANTDSQENPLTHNLEDLFGPYSVSVPPTNAVQNITLYPLGVAVISDAGMPVPGEFDVNVYGQLNANYEVEFSPDLVNWSSVYSFQLTSNPFPLADPNATNAMGFYRLKLVP